MFSRRSFFPSMTPSTLFWNHFGIFPGEDASGKLRGSESRWSIDTLALEVTGQTPSK